MNPAPAMVLLDPIRACWTDRGCKRGSPATLAASEFALLSNFHAESSCGGAAVRCGVSRARGASAQASEDELASKLLDPSGVILHPSALQRHRRVPDALK